MQTSIVNLDLLHKLLQNNKEAIKNALELFIESTESDMELLSTQIKDGNYLDASRMAHALKSRLIYLGNEQLIENVKLLEYKLKNVANEKISEIDDMFYGLNKMVFVCMDQVISEIKKIEGMHNSTF